MNIFWDMNFAIFVAFCLFLSIRDLLLVVLINLPIGLNFQLYYISFSVL
jgi:hypothetical protein